MPHVRGGVRQPGINIAINRCIITRPISKPMEGYAAGGRLSESVVYSFLLYLGTRLPYAFASNVS